jgi:UDP-glucose 4-epimerase
MKNSVIMVTGGAGFIGSHLVEALLANDNEVHVFDSVPLQEANNLREVKNHKNLRYFTGDIRKLDDVKKFWQKDADTIFHLASVVGIKNYIADPLKLVDIVVIGTRHILEEATRSDTKIVFSSTSEIFGKNPRPPWREDDDRVLGATYIDRWSYSSSKAVCEHMLYGMKKSTGLPFTIVRFFNVYGPRQNQYFIVSQTLYKILRSEKPLMYDNGAMTRCFTYIEDIIKGVLLAADNEKAVGEAFNLGNSVEVSVKDVINTALKVSRCDIGYDTIDTRELYGKQYEDIIRRVPNAGKAKELLGWTAQIQLEEGLRRTIEWIKRNPWYLK